MNKHIIIIYHSGFGHTHKVAQAIAEGSGGTLMAINDEGELAEAGWLALDEADAIIFGTPTYMGNMSWQFKKFADASSKVWASQKWKNKLAAGFTNSASVAGDKQTTLYTLFTLAQQHGMLWVGMGMLPSNTKASKRDDINYLSSFAGLATAAPADAGPDEMSVGDLQTARLFGQHVRATAERLS